MKVRKSKLSTFRAFERAAVKVMSEHGGKLERVVVVDDGDPETLREIHVVSFENPAAFSAYRENPKLLPYQALRQASVIETELFVGEDGPDYTND